MGLLLMISSCKDKHEALLGDLGGNWVMTEVVAIESNPDNLVLPSAGTVLFNPCAQQGDGQCQGEFSFDQEARVAFTYSAYSSANQNINLLPDFETPVSYYLTGAWEVLTLEEETLVMKGPLQIMKSDGTSQKLDVKISLAR